MGDTVSLPDGADDTVPATQRSSPASAAPSLVAIDSCVGRYTIRSLLGRGGMGEVYAAHDPALDRPIAIKVMRPGMTSQEARLRFLREAQVLASLDHPNVVAVHDVGTIGDSTFVAMELVDGPTLADWLAEKSRTLDEILDVFVHAGRGLAAVHATGITHRDFKPSNVMLDKSGQRVRVVDFGLARTAGSETTTATTSTRDAAVTASVGAVGTPAYMAPEQLESRWSPRSDQYAFAIALREAITGERTPSETRTLPGWLRPLIDRATAKDPDARFPSMDVFIAKIARGRHRTRRIALASAAVLVIGAVVVAFAVRSSSREVCPLAEERMAGVWDDARREAVHAAFAKTKLPYAEPTWIAVAAALDEYRESWLATQNSACQATSDGRQSTAMLDQQTNCLERQRSRVVGLTQLWLDGMDEKAVQDARVAVTSLPASSQCTTDIALDDVPMPSDARMIGRIATIRTRIDRAFSLASSGHLKDSAALVPAIKSAADTTGWIPVRAEAAYLAGYVANGLRQPDTETLLIAANQLALDAHADELAALAQVTLVGHLSSSHPDRALLAADLADAMIARGGGSDRERARLLRFRGDAYDTLDKPNEARQAYQRAYELASKAFGTSSEDALSSQVRLAEIAIALGDHREGTKLATDALAGLTAIMGEQHPQIARTLHQLAIANYRADNYDTTIAYFERALKIVEATEGPESRNAAMFIGSIGGVEVHRGNVARAEEMMLRAIAIVERLYGPDHPLVADNIGNLTNVYHLKRDFARSAELSRRMLAITTKTFGAEHPKTAGALEGLALALQGSGDLELALTHLRRAVEIRRKTQGDHHDVTLDTMVQLASFLGMANRCGESMELLAIVIPNLEQIGSNPTNALEVRAECELLQHHPDKSLASAQASAEACIKTSPDNPECATRYWLISRAHQALGRRAEAITSAEEAMRRMTDAAAKGVNNEKQRATIQSWLASHKRK